MSVYESSKWKETSIVEEMSYAADGVCEQSHDKISKGALALHLYLVMDNGCLALIDITTNPHWIIIYSRNHTTGHTSQALSIAYW